MGHEDKYKALKKKGHIKERKAREFISELLYVILDLQEENNSLRYKNDELVKNPVVQAFLQLDTRLEKLESKIQQDIDEHH